MSSQSSGIQPHGHVVSNRTASPRRKWAAIGFAAITLQVGVAISVRAATDQPATQPDAVASSSAVQPSNNSSNSASPNNSALLQQGLTQYKAAQYEDAVATLGQADAKGLSDADQITLTDTLVKAQDAVRQRQAARNEFDLGEQSLAANQPADAINHYNAVTKNPFADEGTVRKANEELAVAQQDLNKPVVAVPVDPQRAIYDQAEADMHAGRYSAARQELTQLADAGYQPPIFHRTPKEMLVEIDARTETAPAVTPAPVAVVADTDTTSPATSPAAPSSDTTSTPTTAPTESSPGTATPAPVAPTETAAAPTTSPSDLDRLQAEAENERVAAEQRRFRAAGLVDLARQAYTQGDKTEALRDYSQAASLDPANQQAADGKAQLLVETGRAPAPAASSQFRNQIEVEIQDIRFRFSTAVKDVQAAISTNDFATARRRLEDARVARSIDPGIFPEEEIRQMDASLAELDQQLRDAKAAYDVRTAQATQQEVEEQQKARAEQQREQRDRTVASLIHLARQDIDAGNYTAALGVLDQIEVLSPRNDYAEGVRQFVEDRAVLQDQRRYREMFDLQYSKTIAEAEEKQVPYDDIVRYPTNWPDISEERDEEVKSERGLSREDQATQALLDKVLPEMSFENTPFNEAVDYFRDVTGANIFVNTRALEAAGVDRSATINLKLHNIRFSKALTEVLQVVGGATKLSYDIDDGVITISTADQLNQNVVTQVYDIRDLLVDIPNYQLQDVTQVLSSLNNSSGGTMLGVSGGGGGGGSNNSFSGTSSGGNNTMQRTNKDLMDEMVALIEQTVSPETWRTGGGTVGAISELLASGQLVVIQTPENHRKLQDLLDKIREKRDIMVTVEARFLTVNRDFIEEVGLNLDAVFNTNRSPNSVFSTVPVHLLDDNFTQGVSTGVPGTIGGNATPSTVAFTYLDDFQVNFMLQAVEASNNQSLVNAPKVTVFDGGTAVIGVETLFSYVSNLQPTVGSGGSVGFTANIATVPSGVSLLVKATVSSDRKYVTLQLQPLFTSLLSLVTFQLTEPTSALSGGGSGSGTTIVTGGTSSVGEFVQLPTLQVTTVETIVSVPDGGTLLMGGQTLAGETQRENGTPVLSKIPFLKRLFTNQSMAKDEQVILLLVKPTILIQREQEDKAFPLLSNQASGD